jgi:hypothetical protein
MKWTNLRISLAIVGALVVLTILVAAGLKIRDWIRPRPAPPAAPTTAAAPVTTSPVTVTSAAVTSGTWTKPKPSDAPVVFDPRPYQEQIAALENQKARQRAEYAALIDSVARGWIPTDSLKVRLGILSQLQQSRDTIRPIDLAAIFSWKRSGWTVIPGAAAGVQARLGGPIRWRIFGSLQIGYYNMVKGGFLANDREGGIYLARQAPDFQRINLMIYGVRRYPFARFENDEYGRPIAGEAGKWSVGIGAGINIY